jgi:hypothetical protein
VIVPMHTELKMPAAGVVPQHLPWPLFRSTGSFAADHALNSWALAASSAGLIETLLCADLGPARAGLDLLTGSAPTQRTLAAQLAVVARLNQPKSRTSRGSAARSNAAQIAASRQTKSKLAGSNSAGTLSKPALPAAFNHNAAQPQAIIIDLAAVKSRQRSDKSKRAA